MTMVQLLADWDGSGDHGRWAWWAVIERATLDHERPCGISGDARSSRCTMRAPFLAT